MEPRAPRTARTLVASFAAVAVTFTLATAYAQVANLRIRLAARGITANSSPTVAMLSSMRGLMRQLEVGADEFVDKCSLGTCELPPSQVEELTRALRREWEAYQKIPFFPGENDTWPAIERDLRRLEQEVAVLMAVATPLQGQAAERVFHSTVKPTIDHLDDALSLIIQSDYAHGQELASSIDALAHRAISVSIALDVLSIGLTVVAAALAISFVRRHERLLRARVDELDRFAGRVAHDVSGPLWATSAALVVAERGADERGRGALELAVKSLRLAQDLVKGLLDYARSGAAPAGEGTEDVRSIVEGVVDQLRALAEHHRVNVQVDASLSGTVACSPGILQSIMTNLVGNSIKHMGDSRARRVFVRAGKPSTRDAIRLEVGDTGPGIPLAIQEHVFEPFVRASSQGVPGFGLGLATVKRLVTEHRGHVGFTTDPRGTMFWVELPCAAGEAPRRGAFSSMTP
jgi:signal transduction histidine kinase